MAVTAALPRALADFLGQPTPAAWVERAAESLPELLLDHANCELKAASTALGFIYRYPERARLAWRMSRLAREELRHFEQLRRILDARGIRYRRLGASRYARGLHDAVRGGEPGRLVDRLLVGAFIEARSCERFAALAPELPADLGRFYHRLLESEARHFEHYLAFAQDEAGIDERGMAARIGELRAVENRLIGTPDIEFRFHSGVPARSPQPLQRH